MRKNISKVLLMSLLVSAFFIVPAFATLNTVASDNAYQEIITRLNAEYAEYGLEASLVPSKIRPMLLSPEEFEIRVRKQLQHAAEQNARVIEAYEKNGNKFDEIEWIPMDNESDQNSKRL